MKRVFLAISLKDSEFINQYIKEIKSNLVAENIKWIEAKNAHLTLKFFGPTDNNLLQKIIISLDTTFKEQKRFTISFNKLGIFGSKYQPRVLWMGMENTKPLIDLVNTINQELKQIGIATDRQNFVPHLTIGRIKKLSSKRYFQSVVDRYKEFDSGEIKIEKINLYQSILHKEGPEYKILKSYSLK